MVIARLRAAAPASVLEVGCGWGELAARIIRETGAAVTAIDPSPRMVELARQRGVDARVGDVQELPFENGSFAAVVAAWMLYHVPDLDGVVVFADADAVRTYVGSSIAGRALVDRVPELTEPLVATKRVTVLVAATTV